MNKWQEQVAEFHRKFGQPVADRPSMLAHERAMLRYDLIDEEATELFEAIQAGDLVAAADAVADLIYVTLGAACELGINVEPIMDEVHRSNMAKDGGGQRADGKILKPIGWEPPDIAGCLRAQGWSGDDVE